MPTHMHTRAHTHTHTHSLTFCPPSGYWKGERRSEKAFGSIPLSKAFLRRLDVRRREVAISKSYIGIHSWLHYSLLVMYGKDVIGLGCSNAAMHWCHHATRALMKYRGLLDDRWPIELHADTLIYSLGACFVNSAVNWRSMVLRWLGRFERQMMLALGETCWSLERLGETRETHKGKVSIRNFYYNALNDG